MAIDFRNIRGKLPRNIRISASCNTGDILRIKTVRIPEGEILSGLQRAINRASNKIAIDLKAALDDAMRSPVWPTSAGVADIFETGELMASGSVTVSKNGVTIAYDAPYAALVHYGGYINPYGRANTRVYLPPRPWVDAVLNGIGGIQEFDFATYYQREIEAEFG